MRRSDRTLPEFLTFGALLLTCGAPVDASERTTLVSISPGDRTHAAIAPHRCPTFTWAGGDEDGEIEIALWRVSEGDLDSTELADGFDPEAEPLWRVRLPVGASAWSAADEPVFPAPERTHGGYETLSGREPANWTSPRWLSAPDAPTEAEVEAAIALLERWRETAGGGAAGRPSKRLRTASTGVAPTANGLTSGRSRLGPTDVIALEAELPDTAVETYGVVGRTNSVVTNSAGVFGESTQSTGATFGVFGFSNSALGTGVSGYGALGVEGTSDLDGGIGVLGVATGASLSYGTRGEASTSTGIGAAGGTTQRRATPSGSTDPRTRPRAGEFSVRC